MKCYYIMCVFTLSTQRINIESMMEKKYTKTVAMQVLVTSAYTEKNVKKKKKNE